MIYKCLHIHIMQKYYYILILWMHNIFLQTSIKLYEYTSFSFGRTFRFMNVQHFPSDVHLGLWMHDIFLRTYKKSLWMHDIFLQTCKKVYECTTFSFRRTFRKFFARPKEKVREKEIFMHNIFLWTCIYTFLFIFKSLLYK